MATGRVPTTANSPLTAKGDLFTYSTAPARLAVGNNGEQIVADSSTSTGLRYQAPVQQNPFLNSAMQIWQRGTSTACSTTAYAADRWQAYRAVAGATVSRQVTNDTTNLPNIQYAARVQRDSGNTATNAIFISQSLETINSIQFVGKTVTLSFYARAGANYSAASSALNIIVSSGTGTDQNVLTSYTGANNFISQTGTLTTTWQRFTYTGTVPTTATELGTYIYYTPAGTAGANDYFEITGVQLEVGSVATPFHTYAATIQGELAACQRYYWRSTPGNYFGNYAIGMAGSATLAYVALKLPVTMRIIPTAIEVNSTITALKLTNIVATNWTISAIGLTDSTYDSLMLAVTASGMTTNQALILGNNNNLAAFIGASAEL